MILEAIIVLNMTVSDADTGKELEFVHREYRFGANPDICLSGNLLEAHKLTTKWRERGHPNAFTNVDCHYERVPQGRDA